jgi:hypothetical protein
MKNEDTKAILGLSIPAVLVLVVLGVILFTKGK